MRIIVGLCLIVLWLYLLHAMKRAQLGAWRFFVGCIGLFLFLMVFIRPYVTEPLARCVCALSGVVGSFTDTFAAYFKYGIIYVPSGAESITLMVDFECSGVIEIMVYISLLIFFDVYSRVEKIIVGIGGVACLMLCNALRIVIIAEMVHFFGVDAYYAAHAFVGRIFFYLCSIILYFYVFTKPQVVRMKVGSFAYEHHKETT